MYKDDKARRTLFPRYLTEYHTQAQWAEFTKLKEIIGNTYRSLERPILIFDIGIGTSRVPLLLSRVATWEKIGKYMGIDISPFCVDRSRRVAKARRIDDKLEVVLFDALDLSTRASELLKYGEYDLVVCTYFTAGDFKPDEIKLERKGGVIANYDLGLLKPNKNFIAVFKGALSLLRCGGQVVIGSLYRDTPFVREIQEKFYKKCGMTVITSEEDPFTATEEGFWSERFSKEKVYEYLPWIPRNRIEQTPLDDYDFAFMVSIKK